MPLHFAATRPKFFIDQYVLFSRRVLARLLKIKIIFFNCFGFLSLLHISLMQIVHFYLYLMIYQYLLFHTSFQLLH